METKNLGEESRLEELRSMLADMRQLVEASDEGAESAEFTLRRLSPRVRRSRSRMNYKHRVWEQAGPAARR